MSRIGGRLSYLAVVALAAVGLCVVAPLLIGIADLANGPDYGLVLFYLVPIVIAGFRMGTAAAITA